jgi:hypothetical protein
MQGLPGVSKVEPSRGADKLFAGEEECSDACAGED